MESLAFDSKDDTDKMWEEIERAREARRQRAQEGRRLARETPDAPPSPFFSPDELFCIGRLGIRIKTHLRPDTIWGALNIASALGGRLLRKSDLVYLPAVKTLEGAFECLERQVMILELARKRNDAALLSDEGSKEFHELSRYSVGEIKLHFAKADAMKELDALADLALADLRRGSGAAAEAEAPETLAEDLIDGISRRLCSQAGLTSGGRAMRHAARARCHELGLAAATGEQGALGAEDRLVKAAAMKELDALAELSLVDIRRQHRRETHRMDLGILTNMVFSGLRRRLCKVSAEAEKAIEGFASVALEELDSLKGNEAEAEKFMRQAEAIAGRLAAMLGLKGKDKPMADAIATALLATSRRLGPEGAKKEFERMLRLSGLE